MIILEDDPYYFLSFGEGNAQSYFSFDVEGRVVRFDSFSKILAGGIRLGYARVRGGGGGEGEGVTG